MIAKSCQWQLTTVAVAALLGIWATDASALSLGRINVQSALGEPLKAEIDVLDINADEAASLTTRVAAPDAFKAAGLEYNAAMTSLQAKLQRRPDGRAYIQLSSSKAINDPFVDMILEANWSSGRIVRDYTMLFDPPNLRRATASTPATIPATTQLPAAAPVQAPTAPAVKPAPVVVQAKPVATPKPAPQLRQPETQTIAVKAGDTAGRIAAATKPASVSLDQMLIALLRANPQAFISNNVNRIKAGAVVTLPSEEQAGAMPAAEATQTIIAQSRDFNDFRRKLASSVPTTQVAPASRDVIGKVQATVDEKKPAAPAPDKLTLSKGSVQEKTREDQLAQVRNAKEAASRADELAKNISDLSKLAAASSASAAASVAAKASSPGLPSAPAVPTATAEPEVAASTPVPPPAPPAVAASLPKPPVSARAKPAAEPEPPVEPSFLDTLLENPLLPIGAGGLIALLAGFGFYKNRQRKKASQLESTFNESSLQPESFFKASGGQNVDTNDNLTTGSSMVYSPSQLDAVDDVDPVAEADVYLAYGRDLQAEEILKDALRSNPQRLAIYQKLLEIYAKRRDAKGFESIATLVFNLTDGTGSAWENICKDGLSLEPDNVLYLPGGQPLAVPKSTAGPATAEATVPIPLVSEADADAHSRPDDGSLDMDLDLDFSLDEPEEPSAAMAPELAPPALEETEQLPTLWSELSAPTPPDLSEPEPEAEAEPEPAPALQTVAEPEPEPEPPEIADLNFDVSDFALSLPEVSAPTPAEPIEPMFELEDYAEVDDTPQSRVPSGETSPMPFDLASLSLDLGDNNVTEAGAFPEDTEDPLETKLALADEFRAIGDDDGARALIEEVIVEATGDMKAKAQRALGKL